MAKNSTAPRVARFPGKPGRRGEVGALDLLDAFAAYTDAKLETGSAEEAYRLAARRLSDRYTKTARRRVELSWHTIRERVTEYRRWHRIWNPAHPESVRARKVGGMHRGRKPMKGV